MTDEVEKREDLFRKIRGLLNKAEKTTFEHEADAFLRKAQELMVKYSVNEELLWKSDLSKEPPAPITMVMVIRDKTGKQWLQILLNSCARFNRCKMYMQGGVMKVVGFESDTLFVEMLYVSIKKQMDFSLATAIAFADENARVFRNNFTEAFCMRIHERLAENDKALRAQMHSDGSSTELVVLGREQRVKKWMDENVGSLRHVGIRSSGQYSSGAQASGRFAGDAADISGHRGKVNTGVKPQRSLGR
jgi:uncharacterized protein DUF2786